MDIRFDRADPLGVRIRPMRPGDAPLVAEFVRDLSPQSRYQRFHAGLRELSADELERFTRFDPCRALVLVATVVEAGREAAVGEARYAPSDGDEPGAREFALSVADRVQRRGIGERLLRRLVRHARRAAVARLYGDLIRDNLRVLRLVRKLGFEVRRHPGDGRLQRVERALGIGFIGPAMQRGDRSLGYL